LVDEGFRRIVEPKVVLEVAFNNMQRSSRHDSGFALRFPRILRIRSDKTPEQIDTLERVRELYAKQITLPLMAGGA
jgi:DNA ligase-1